MQLDSHIFVAEPQGIKGKTIKKAISSDLPEESRREIEALASMAEEDIDTSDIPEVLDWSGAKRGLFYRPVKQQLTLRLDADVIDWFRREGTGVVVPDERRAAGICQPQARQECRVMIPGVSAGVHVLRHP